MKIRRDWWGFFDAVLLVVALLAWFMGMTVVLMGAIQK